MSVNKNVTVPDGNSTTRTPILDDTSMQVNQANRTTVTCAGTRQNDSATEAASASAEPAICRLTPGTNGR